MKQDNYVLKTTTFTYNEVFAAGGVETPILNINGVDPGVGNRRGVGWVTIPEAMIPVSISFSAFRFLPGPKDTVMTFDFTVPFWRTGVINALTPQQNDFLVLPQLGMNSILSVVAPGTAPLLYTPGAITSLHYYTDVTNLRFEPSDFKSFPSTAMVFYATLGAALNGNTGPGPLQWNSIAGQRYAISYSIVYIVQNNSY
jgi:hypothetical protein